MNIVLQDVQLWLDGRFERRSLWIVDGILHHLGEEGPGAGWPTAGAELLDCSRYQLFPGFTDAHVHLREPGFSYKETMETGSRAAARGGFSAVITMPNLQPAPDSLAKLLVQEARIQAGACITVKPLGTITRDEMGQELSDMEALAPRVAGFSDDGRGVQDQALMKKAMETARRLGKVIVAHAEDESLVAGGVIHDGDFARQHGLPGNPSASEWAQVARDIDLVRRTGASYHVCHVSTKESVALIRQAKEEGLDISCETTPHYLLMNDSMLRDEGRFKMNPPIRAAEDQKALLAGLLDGTVDMIATDHAPHSQAEKAKGLLGSMNGVVGLETAFPLLYHHLVLPGTLPLKTLVDALHRRPNQRFGLPLGLEAGQAASLCLWDLAASYPIDPEEFVSLGKATPFTGWQASGRCLLTISQGRIAHREGL